MSCVPKQGSFCFWKSETKGSPQRGSSTRNGIFNIQKNPESDSIDTGMRDGFEEFQYLILGIFLRQNLPMPIPRILHKQFSSNSYNRKKESFLPSVLVWYIFP